MASSSDQFNAVLDAPPHHRHHGIVVRPVQRSPRCSTTSQASWHRRQTSSTQSSMLHHIAGVMASSSDQFNAVLDARCSGLMSPMRAAAHSATVLLVFSPLSIVSVFERTCSLKQVCAGPLSSALNMTLPVFAAERGLIQRCGLPQARRRQRARSCRSMSRARRALSSKPAGRC